MNTQSLKRSAVAAAVVAAFSGIYFAQTGSLARLRTENWPRPKRPGTRRGGSASRCAP